MKYQKHVILILALFIIVLVLVGSALKRKAGNQGASSGQVNEKLQEDTIADQYNNSSFGILFKYPKNWYGPEIYEYENGFRFEIGTDIVYPYGAERADRKYTKENSYYFIVQFDKNDTGNTNADDVAENPNLQQYSSLRDLKDGEVLEDTRSLKVKVRDINSEGIRGVEYISTLSETAQTELFYSRNVILINDKNDIITIMGSPNNVVVENKEEWKKYYEDIDKEKLLEFTDLVNSVTFY